MSYQFPLFYQDGQAISTSKDDKNLQQLSNGPSAFGDFGDILSTSAGLRLHQHFSLSSEPGIGDRSVLGSQNTELWTSQSVPTTWPTSTIPLTENPYNSAYALTDPLSTSLFDSGFFEGNNSSTFDTSSKSILPQSGSGLAIVGESSLQEPETSAAFTGQKSSKSSSYFDNNRGDNNLIERESVLRMLFKYVSKPTMEDMEHIAHDLGYSSNFVTNAYWQFKNSSSIGDVTVDSGLATSPPVLMCMVPQKPFSTISNDFIYDIERQEPLALKLTAKRARIDEKLDPNSQAGLDSGVKNKPHRCSQCDQPFCRPSDLRRHLKSHRAGEFHCLYTGCDKVFNRKDKMVDHWNRVHANGASGKNMSSQKRNEPGTDPDFEGPSGSNDEYGGGSNSNAGNHPQSELGGNRSANSGSAYEHSSNTGFSFLSAFERRDLRSRFAAIGTTERENFAAIRDFRAKVENLTMHTPSGQSYVRVSKLIQWLESKVSYRDCTTTQANRLLEAEYGNEDVIPITRADLTDGQKPCLLIFCILIQLGHGNLIHEFWMRDKGDGDLPMDRSYLKASFGDVVGEAFGREQWRFCPAKLELGKGYDFDGKMIIPLHRKERINGKGGTACLWRIEILEDFLGLGLRGALKRARFDSSTDGWGPRYQFALKVFKGESKPVFENEQKAFTALRGHQGVVQNLAYFRHGESNGPTNERNPPQRLQSTKRLDGSKTYNILLECGECDLDEYFANQFPPILGNEVSSFWKSLSEVAYALENLHNFKANSGEIVKQYQGFHLDLKPENILYVDGSFKLADLGFARILEKKEEVSDPQVKLLGGTATYAPPECYLRDRVSHLVTQKFDIWSLGCVYSIAATWVALGYEGTRQYSKIREKAINKIIQSQQHEGPPTADKPLLNPGNYFHDGQQLLQAITEWHRYIRRSILNTDTVTSQVLDIIETKMLIGSQELRPKATTISKDLKNIEYQIERKPLTVMPRASKKNLVADAYTIAIICVLPLEVSAVATMMDELHQSNPIRLEDDSEYTRGRIGEQNVVIAGLPKGMQGKAVVADVAGRIRLSFKNIVVGLLVGIGGEVPRFPEMDVRLGDVVVGVPKVGPAVSHYDPGKRHEIQDTRVVERPLALLLRALNKVERKFQSAEGPEDFFTAHLQRFKKVPATRDVYKCPSVPDQLFFANYEQGYSTKFLSHSQPYEVIRPDREPPKAIRVHYSTILPGNLVMKSGVRRDQISPKFHDALCFEMEATGLIDVFPCLVIRGVCDYADSHKTKDWQLYAAATAAAYAREIILAMTERVEDELQESELSSQSLLQRRPLWVSW